MKRKNCSWWPADFGIQVQKVPTGIIVNIIRTPVHNQEWVGVNNRRVKDGKDK